MYAAAARERGIAELALTEHCHRFRQAAGISQHAFWNETAHADLDAYVGALAARARRGPADPRRHRARLARRRRGGPRCARSWPIATSTSCSARCTGSPAAMVDHPGYSDLGIALGRRRVAAVLRGAAPRGAVGPVRRDGASRPAEGVRRAAGRGRARSASTTRRPTRSRPPASPARSRRRACARRPRSCIPAPAFLRPAPRAACRSRSPRTVTGPRTSDEGSSTRCARARTPATAR